jgi:hypothetical protein
VCGVSKEAEGQFPLRMSAHTITLRSVPSTEMLRVVCGQRSVLVPVSRLKLAHLSWLAVSHEPSGYVREVTPAFFQKLEPLSKRSDAL